MVGWGALLVEGLGFGSVDEALEDDGTVSDSVQCAGRDGEVVADEVELRELGLFGEIELAGVGHADFVTVDREEFDVFGFFHGFRLHLYGLYGRRMGRLMRCLHARSTFVRTDLQSKMWEGASQLTSHTLANSDDSC